MDLGIERGDGRVVPCGDLTQVDLGQYRSGELQPRVNAGHVVRHGNPTEVDRHLQYRSLRRSLLRRGHGDLALPERHGVLLYRSHPRAAAGGRVTHGDLRIGLVVLVEHPPVKGLDRTGPDRRQGRRRGLGEMAGERTAGGAGRAGTRSCHHHQSHGDGRGHRAAPERGVQTREGSCRVRAGCDMHGEHPFLGDRGRLVPGPGTGPPKGRAK